MPGKRKGTTSAASKAKKGKVEGTASERILIALAKLRGIGKLEPLRRQVAHYAMMDPKSSTFANALTKLKRTGLVDTSNSKTLSLTEKGLDAAGGPEAIKPPTSNKEIHDNYRQMIGGGKPLELFEILAAASGPMSRSQLARELKVDEKKSTFANALTPLRKLDLLEDVAADGAKGKLLQMPDSAFPFGRGSTTTTTTTSSSDQTVPTNVAVSPDRK